MVAVFVCLVGFHSTCTYLYFNGGLWEESSQLYEGNGVNNWDLFLECSGRDIFISVQRSATGNENSFLSCHTDYFANYWCEGEISY